MLNLGRRHWTRRAIATLVEDVGSFFVLHPVGEGTGQHIDATVVWMVDPNRWEC